MEGSCPRCRTRLDLPRSGTFRCERCGTTFDVVLGEGLSPLVSHPATAPYGPGWVAPYAADPYLAPQPAAEPEPETGATCTAHPDRSATRTCERCGDFICRLCATPVEGRVYCPKCFDLLHARGSFGFNQRAFNDPMMTLCLGGIGLLMTVMVPISLILAITGTVFGVRALRTHGSRPDLPGRGMTLAGLSLCGLTLVTTLSWSGWVVWRLARP